MNNWTDAIKSWLVNQTPSYNSSSHIWTHRPSLHDSANANEKQQIQRKQSQPYSSTYKTNIYVLKSDHSSTFPVCNLGSNTCIVSNYMPICLFCDCNFDHPFICSHIAKQFATVIISCPVLDVMVFSSNYLLPIVPCHFSDMQKLFF